jgi:hypothetical protein
MHYCVIRSVDSVADATAVGMELQRLGYKIIAAQVTPANCPIGAGKFQSDGCTNCADTSVAMGMEGLNFNTSQ